MKSTLLKPTLLRTVPLLLGTGLPVMVLAIAAESAPANTSTPTMNGATTNAATPWTTPLQGDQKIAHVLNRLTFGPRPGDIERVRTMGLDKWIEEQLQPQKIDDSAVERSVAKLPLLNAPFTFLSLAYEGGQGTQTKLAATSKAQAQQEAADGMAANGMGGNGMGGNGMGGNGMGGNGMGGNGMAGNGMAEAGGGRRRRPDGAMGTRAVDTRRQEQIRAVRNRYAPLTRRAGSSRGHRCKR